MLVLASSSAYALSCFALLKIWKRRLSNAISSSSCLLVIASLALWREAPKEACLTFPFAARAGTTTVRVSVGTTAGDTVGDLIGVSLGSGVVSLGGVATGLSNSIGFGEGLLGDGGRSDFMLAGGHLLVTGALVLGAGSGGASRCEGDALVGVFALGTLGDLGGTLDGSGGGRDIVNFLYGLAN